MLHIHHRHIFRTGLLIVLALLAGCSATPFADRYQPGASDVTLWGSERIPLDPAWRYVGPENLTVRGDLRDTALTPLDHMQTLIFVRGDEEAPSILLLSRVIKSPGLEEFVFLGGTKTLLGDVSYRESGFTLSKQTEDPEYRRYLDRVHAGGIPLASGYSVRVLDRLPTNQVLVRIMELTPDEGGGTSLPAYGRLYPQELEDVIRNRFR